jgi:putative inorganic carbon (hco3(-)) transporter
VAILASMNAALAVAFVLSIALVVATLLHHAVLLTVLMASIFLEVITLGGLTISRLLGPVALAVLVSQLLQGRAKILPARPLFWAIAYGTWALASGLWTVSTVGTIHLLASLAIALTYMLAFAALLTSRGELERVLYALVMASFFVGFSSMASYFDELGGFGSLLQGGRAQGGVGDPSFFAAVQLVALPLALVLAAETRRRWLQLCLYGAIFVMIGSIVTSLSRGGLIGLAVFLIAFALWPARSLVVERRQKVVLLVIVAIGIALVSWRTLPELTERIESIYKSAPAEGTSGGETRGSGRLDIWLGARQTASEHPVFGVGFGAWRFISNDLLLSTPGVDPVVYKPRPTGDGIEAHNTYLGTAAELGLTGLVLYLGVLISTGVYLRRTARRAREAGADFVSRVANALLLGLMTWAVSSFFLSMETSRAFWIVIGLALALPKLIPDAGPDGRTEGA